MAVLTGYFDDSQTDGLIFTLAGYVGGERHWEVFQEQWNRALNLHDRRRSTSVKSLHSWAPSLDQLVEAN
jgi:hypothetical protein